MDRHQTRRNRLRKLLRKEQLDGLLITNFKNVTYLTGFTGDDSWLLVTPREEVILSDFRYTEQLDQECPGLRQHIRPSGQTIVEAAEKVIEAAKCSSLGIEGRSLTVSAHETLREKLKAVAIKTTADLVEQLREVKDAEEIAETRRAVRLAERAFAVLRATLTPDQTEKQVADRLEHQLRLFGAAGCSFPPIVAAGARAALPHARPNGQLIGDADLLLVDWGAQSGLYKSDLTRVLVTGKITSKLERIYGVVLKAQAAAVAAIRPGVLAEDVDAAARSVIEKAGYGPQFGHSVGHGIGLDIHERPRMAINQKLPLRAGMIVTVEPGIYVPGWGGVRIEDDVLVTREGHEVLSSVPKEFSDAVVQ